MMFPSCALTMFPMVSRRGSTFVFFFFFFSLSHSMKAFQSTDARSEAFGKGGACGVEAPKPHLYLLASPRRPICEWIHLSTYLNEPQNACLKPSSPRRSATSLLHGLHRLRGGGSLRGLHRLHRHGYATA